MNLREYHILSHLQQMFPFGFKMVLRVLKLSRDAEMNWNQTISSSLGRTVSLHSTCAAAQSPASMSLVRIKEQT